MQSFPKNEKAARVNPQDEHRIAQAQRVRMRSSLKPDLKRSFPIVLGLFAVLTCEPGCTQHEGFAERADPTKQNPTADDAARFLAVLRGRPEG